MSTELKLTGSNNDEKVNEIAEAVKNLANNEAMIVASDENFFEIIPSLQQAMKGEIIWSPMINGPDLWKGRVFKTSNASIHGSIIGYMTFDHKRCDELYADAEAAWQEGNNDDAIEMLKGFDLGMRRHLSSEENILFPAFTAATGMEGGPVQVMIMEHDQMRGVLTQISEAVEANDLDTACAAGDTMVILMQQHNVKEEGILYPMIEQHAEGDMEDLIQRLQLHIAS